MRAPSILLTVSVFVCGCSDADIYSRTGAEPITPDRLIITGDLCTDDASGSKFPVKVLFALDSTTNMFATDQNGDRFAGPAGSIDGIVQRNFYQPHVRFGFIGFGDTAVAYPTSAGQQFFRPQDPEIVTAITQLQSPIGARRDMKSLLSQISGFVHADIASANPGEILRSRYLVSVLAAGPPYRSCSKAAADVLDDLVGQLESIIDGIYATGVLEFSINFGFIEPTSDYNPSSCSTTAQDATDAREAYETLAFVANGQFTEFATNLGCCASINFEVDIATSKVNLVKKDIVAYNRNVVLRPDGPQVDSDGDGLTDADELDAGGTSPTLSDTDLDGLSDRIEYRTFPSQDPLDGTDRPTSCQFPPIPDRDTDLLNDCEEGLLQSSATIPDTDGDGLTDLLEFLSGMIPISADDRLLDFDDDGFKNAEEVLDHTDPRGNDVQIRSAERYRNLIKNLGQRTVASMDSAPELRGIVFRRSSPGVVGGQAFLRWRPCDGTLEWSDARYPTGVPPYDPRITAIPTNGIYQLFAQSPNSDEIWAEFEITKEFLPTCADGEEHVAFPLISVSERTCYDVRISNIKLMETEPANGNTVRGLNEVLVFFTQSPDSRPLSPGISKLAIIPVNFHCEDPSDLFTCTRDPADGTFLLTDDIFVTALP